MSEATLNRLHILELVRSGVISVDVGQELLRKVRRSGAPAASGWSTDVAVIGISGRFPDARDISELWSNLAAGRDSVREIPPERWDVREHYSPDPLARDKTYSKWMAYVDDIAQFDPDFFAISPREARLMDPQQRLFLMEAWNALEDAGYADRSLAESDCSVYVGVGTGDYHKLVRQHGGPLEGYTFTGMHVAILASRLSYHLNLRGPSIAVDTSCSSSLMAVHLACEEIRAGRRDMAVAGGVALLTTPELHILASKSGMLSPSGRCRTFDDGADGFVPGEAVGAVVLKRLDAALRDGDHVHGVLSASCANQDGKTNGITAPSGPSQTALEIATYERFGIDPADITYVECHGTGTRLGDPIEVDALARAFGRFTNRRGYCAVGSIKSNIGHTLTAAGIAGLIKVLLCLRHRRLVPSLHVQRTNRHIRFDQGPFYVSTELREWEPPAGGPRTAALSSFGFSGTNVHAVVREAPSSPLEPAEDAGRARLFAVSAKSEEALRERLHALSHWLNAEGARHPWRDVSYTLSVGRSHLPLRAAFVAHGPEELRARIRSHLAGGPAHRTEALRLEEVADAYRAGQPIEWDDLFVGERCRRVPMPTYPFARERYWIPDVSTPSSTVRDEKPRRGAPQPVAPRAALAEGREVVVRRTLLPDEPIVRDHVVMGKPLLPAAGHLGLLHEALRDFAGGEPVSLSRTLFLRPLFVEERTEVQAVLRMREAGRITFEIRTRQSDGGTITHSRGEVRIGAAITTPARVPINEVRARCHALIDAGSLYSRFDTDGIHYGPYFSTVREVRYGATEALAALVQEGVGEPFPAAILDGAIQSVAVLEWDKPGVYLPFGMERVHVLRPIPRESYAHVLQSKPGDCQVVISDQEGAPCVIIEGFSYREFKEQVATRLYLPEWREVSRVAEAARPAERILVVAPTRPLDLEAMLAARHPGAEMLTLRVDSSDDGTSLAAAAERLPGLDRIYFLSGLEQGPIDILSLDSLERSHALGVRALFRLVKALLQRGLGPKTIDLTVVTNDVHAITDGEERRPHAASLFGLCRSLAKELPSWRVSSVDVSGRELFGGRAGAIADAIVAAPPDPNGDEIVLRDDRRYARILRAADVPAAPRLPYRTGGTYVILGGAGGIGAELSLHLARRARARIVLLGRRDPTKALEDKIDAIAAAGGEALYLQVDATNDAAMSAAFAEAKRHFGSIHGVFHSALVLRDGLLDRMDEATFESALAPKVRGSVVLVRSLQREPLDFLVFFSSAQSFSGNPGQSNYSAACTFQDAFAGSLRSSMYPVHIVNWGYWGEVGVVARPEYRRRMQAMGVHSIRVEEGMDALDKILAHRIPQAMPLKAERHVLEKFGVAMNEPAVRAVRAPDVWDPLADRTAVTAPDIARLRRAHTMLDALGARLLLRAIQEMGALRRAGEAASAESLRKRLSIAPAFELLWGTLIDLLAAEGYVRREGAEWCSQPAVETVAHLDLADERLRLCKEYPEIRAHADLLWTCASEYPRVLRGEVTPTEIMFPRSSMELVERVYRGDVLSDYQNELVAQAVRAYVERSDAPARIRILEVGAGTGGTTTRVLEVLEPHADRVEYLYTDVSLSFLQHGRRHFGRRHHFLTFKTLDIERDVTAQDFDAGVHEIVVASNVLHATRRLVETSRNVATLLRPGGWLVLNETTAFSPFATLTFGLLEGWWRWEDADVRLPGSPLASVATWKRLLADTGFGRVAILGATTRADPRFGQHVLLAELDRATPAPRAAVLPLHTPHAGAVARPPARASGAPGARASVEGLLSEVISATLGRDDADLDPDRPFSEYGVDSMILAEMVSTLNDRLGIAIKTTALFDYPTLRELASFIAAELPPAGPSSPAGPRAMAAEAPALSDAAPAEPALGVRARVEQVLAESIASTLGRDDAEFDVDRPFSEYGVDSMILAEMVNVLNERLGLQLKTTALFDHPTLRELTIFVCRKLGAAGAPPDEQHAPERLMTEKDAETDLLAQLAEGALTLDETYRRLRQGNG